MSALSHVQLFATSWTLAYQAPLSIGFSRQEYWSRLLCPPPGDLPDPGIEPMSLTSPALRTGFFLGGRGVVWKGPGLCYWHLPPQPPKCCSSHPERMALVVSTYLTKAGTAEKNFLDISISYIGQCFCLNAPVFLPSCSTTVQTLFYFALRKIILCQTLIT